MSLIGRSYAVVSLGLSCQITWQIRRNSDLISGILGEGAKLAPFKMYFDYIITSKQTLLKFIRGEFPALEKASEICLHSNAPYWPEYKIWFEHNFRKDGFSSSAIDLVEGFEKSAHKIEYLRQKFLSLDALHRNLVFVIGNPQYNLRWKARADDAFHEAFMFDRGYVSDLVEGLSGRFGERFRGLLLVEGSHLNRLDWGIDGVERRTLPPGLTWEGDDDAWSVMLGEALPKILKA